MIVKIPNNIDIVLTMSWIPGQPHGICGHLYEMIEYGMLLSKSMNVGLFFGDTIHSKTQLKNIILDKYTYTEKQIDGLVKNTIIHENPTYVIGSNMLLVDGGLRRFQEYGVRLIFKNIICFKCSYMDTIHDRCYDNVTLLQDDRVYIDVTPEDCDISTQYIKKIDLAKLRAPRRCDNDNNMLYLTRNCRELALDKVLEILDRKPGEYLIVTNDVDRYSSLEQHGVSIVKAPVNNLFERFETYIYTPTFKMWDGSPRFPVECVYFDRGVEFYDIDDQYLSIDRGLYYRMNDLRRDINSVTLKQDDEIIGILDEII